MLQDIFKMTKENNKMLHAMRRNAFIGGILRFVIWILLFVVAPYWIYMTYLAPVVQQMNATLTSFQGTGAKAQAQFGSLQETLKNLEEKIPHLPGSGTSGQN